MERDFKKILTARFLFTVGVQMQAIVVGWQMYQLTHDALHLGLIGLAEAAPAIGFAIFAGYLVDRSRPLAVFLAVLLGSLASALIILLSLTHYLALGIHEQVLALYIASFITGASRSFSQPAIFAIIPRIVPRADLARASAWSTSTMQIARVSGPALGGLAFGWFGSGMASALICIFLLGALAAALLITRTISPPLAKQGRRISQELLLGATFVFRHPILLPALSLDMISVFFGGVTALLPIFASEILNVGPKGLGLLRAAPAVGGALTGIWLARADIRARAGSWLFTAVSGFGISILVFGFSHNIWLSLFALAISGAFDSVSMVIRSTAVQLASPDDMRGRISAVNSIFIGSSNELGEFESGVAARFLGAVPSVFAGGFICLLTVAAAYCLSPALRGLDLRVLENEKKGA